MIQTRSTGAATISLLLSCPFLAVAGCTGVQVSSLASSATASQSSSPGGQYVGCYSDPTTRALPAELMTQNATPASCVAAAKAAGYAYAGVQHGGQCFAGNTLGYTHESSSHCDIPCAINPSEICGGTWANGVYATGATGGSTLRAQRQRRPQRLRRTRRQLRRAPRD
jgi:hypothetical protein